MKPTISVIMTIHNTSQYLREAIDSILFQTFTDFEFLIFNDGSTDNSAEIVRSYNDPRILFFDEPKSQSWVSLLNKGIKLARGKYIARMDSDDISLPHRFEKQVAFMDNNLQVGLCSAWLETIGPNTHISKERPIGHVAIKHQLLIANPIAHALVMIRAQVLKANNLYYNETFLAAQDTEFWGRLIHFTKFQIIPDVLYLYRMHPQQNTTLRKKIQGVNGVENKINYIKSWGVSLTELEEKYLRLLFNPCLHNVSSKEIRNIQMQIPEIINKLKTKNFDSELLIHIFNKHLQKMLLNISQYNLSYLSIFINISKTPAINTLDRFKLIVKSIINWKVNH
ncbi:glycosyltransferase family 2 protein [Adhaeribacter terreus]|uniref:Glycosyltransferase family 2 protein n=1 Tax=Adhaeribacter terreus TaxID=529703 RepID=A0ABW0E6V8_9BACT